MKFSRKIVHGIKNPEKAFQYLFGGSKGKQKIVSSFIKDYSKDVIPLSKLSSFIHGDITRYYDELTTNDSYITIEKSIIDNWSDLRIFGFTEARLLYTLCRFCKPEIVIETGVASGLSSAMILLGLEKNNKGHLFSIDLPFNQRKLSKKEIQNRQASFPPNKREGWLVPESLQSRWTLQLGDSKILLPKLLNELGKCDLFLHDSDHTYKHMMWEFESVWPHLKSILLADDIRLNNAFDDFVEKHFCRSIKISDRFGLIVPSTKIDK
ncbi:MAG: class I SAM-dependent methyltransferase [Nitrosopumilaceae archaeon]